MSNGSVLGLFDDHDPKDKLDYTIRWRTWLNGDQITGSSWAAASENPDSAMFITNSTFTTGTATIWLASGTPGSTYRFENQIGTLSGRDKNDAIQVTVRDE